MESNDRPKAYIIRMATTEPYLNKFTSRCKYVSSLSREELDKIRRNEEGYANHNIFSFLCNF